MSAFADRMAEQLPQLDILINNAGITACPLARVGPGWESQFGVTTWPLRPYTGAASPAAGCEDCDIAEPTDPASPTARFRGVDDHASSDESAERLWAVSEDLLARASR